MSIEASCLGSTTYAMAKSVCNTSKNLLLPQEVVDKRINMGVIRPNQAMMLMS